MGMTDRQAESIGPLSATAPRSVRPPRQSNAHITRLSNALYAYCMFALTIRLIKMEDATQTRMR